MKNITSILASLTSMINNATTTSTTTATTTTTVEIDGKPTTTTATTTATTTTRANISAPEAPKKPALTKELIPAIGWTNPFAEPLKLREEPYKLITSDFRKEVSGSFMMSVVREYPDGRQEMPQREGYDMKIFKRNLEASIERLKEDVALNDWTHTLFADNHSRRWWFYLTTEYISDPEAQALMRWFNRQIGDINRFCEGVHRRLQQVRDEAIAGLADNDNGMIEDLAADLDEVKDERDRLREENASLEANLAEAERYDVADLSATIFAIGDILGIGDGEYGTDASDTVFKALKKRLGIE